MTFYYFNFWILWFMLLYLYTYINNRDNIAEASGIILVSYK